MTSAIYFFYRVRDSLLQGRSKIASRYTSSMDLLCRAISWRRRSDLGYQLLPTAIFTGHVGPTISNCWQRSHILFLPPRNLRFAPLQKIASVQCVSTRMKHGKPFLSPRCLSISESFLEWTLALPFRVKLLAVQFLGKCAVHETRTGQSIAGPTRPTKYMASESLTFSPHQLSIYTLIQ